MMSCAFLRGFARFLVLACALGATPLGAPQLVAAQLAGATPATTYEARRTARLLAEERLEPEPAPEGKAIAWIKVVRDEVFVRDEAFPYWLNWFHALSREQVVRRELLFDVGIPYVDARIEETMRNLRGMGIFALVRITAVKTKDPNAVGILVHTRDLWSLRLETAFNGTTFVDSLLVRATERNLFGYNKALGADITLVPKSYTIGQTYYARRVLNSGIALNERAGLILNRASQNVEGKIGSLWVGQPFYALKQRYAYHVDANYDGRVLRTLDGKDLAVYRPAGSTADDPFAYGVYRQTYKTSTAAFQVRVGSRIKHTWSVGWDYRALSAHPIAETELPDSLAADFARDVLPRQRTESGPTTSYDAFTPTFATLNNVGTFGQSENVRVGPRLTVGLRMPRTSFGSSIASTVMSGTLSYTAVAFGGYADASATAAARYERARWVDQHATLLLRGASPTFSIFRLVTRLELDLRRRDTFNTFVGLGASNGLRGYRARSINGRGDSFALGNVELRTLPIAWQAVHVGGVLFYDVGSVFANSHDIVLHHAVGVGIRVLFPQFNKYPFSFDGGMALGRDIGFLPTFSSGQVVPLTAGEDPS